LTNVHPIIDGIDVVMVSRTMDSEEHSKNESKDNSEKVADMEVEEIIEGRLQSDSISLTISKKEHQY